MNEELLMELSDCGSPEGLAQIIHAHIPLQENGSINLAAVAKAVGIKEIKPTDTKAYEGLLITDNIKSKGIILYNSDSNTYRKRFTVAHELGHFLLPFHDKNAQCASSDLMAINKKAPNHTKEVEANRFAIELLAPKKHINKLLNSYTEPDIEQIFTINSQFKISKEAATRRFIECTDHNVAVIFGKSDIVRYVMKTEDFPYISLNKGNTVPAHISMQIKDKEAGDVIDWFCVDPDYFLSNPRDSHNMELYCQTSLQKDNFHISLLSLENE